ncbi:MAG: hypothetical protein ACREQY_21285 [Candidatus Binatia bacterium]
MITPLGRRFLIGSIVAAGLCVAYYLHATRSLAVPPSGRTLDGVILGVLGTAAMLGAALYSWRRRFIARASRRIEIDSEKRKDLIARERRALEKLQALQRTLMRQPNTNPKQVLTEARKIVRENAVGRTIRVRVEGGRGRAARLIPERREWAGRLQTWYMWHLSLGCLAVLLILLHAGFRFGNVVATLAFVCLVGVVSTGMIGVLIYWLVPPRLTLIEERAERTPEELRDELGQVLAELEEIVQGKSETFRRVYQQELSIPDVSMKPSPRWLFGPATVARDTARPDRLRLVVKEIPPSEQEDFRKAMRLVFRKEKIDVSLYPQLRYDYLMKVWLSAHIPLSAGMWAFSVIHVVSILYF